MTNIFSVVISTPDAGDIIVMAHNNKPLGDQEWMEQYISHVAKLYVGRVDPKVSNLVFATGSGPTTKQRNLGNAAIADGKPYKLNVAVVTDSRIARGAVTALSWFNPLIKAYPPDQVLAAAARVGLQSQHMPQLVAAMRTIGKEVGDVTVLDHAIGVLSAKPQERSRDQPTLR